ncbi:MAG: hypothetical protein A2017_09010 [Lentisphaerae bacterium GWF2_44_16]|nr:MAG: hypothetical protein A2017_09010 [Lentisphaerae bacterium GWF2_44_16]
MSKKMWTMIFMMAFSALTVIAESSNLKNSPIREPADSVWKWDPVPESWKSIDLNNTWKFIHLGNDTWKPKDDLSDDGMKNKYFSPSFDDSAWKNIPVPWTWNMEYGYNDKRLNLYGVCWYRKQFELNDFNAEKEKVLLEFKGIAGVPYLWVNGNQAPILTEAGYYFSDKNKKDPEHAGILRQYVDITPFVKNGENVIALRIYDARKHMTRAKTAGLVSGAFVRIIPPLYFDYTLVTPGEKEVNVELYPAKNVSADFSGIAKVMDAADGKVIGNSQVTGKFKHDSPLLFSVPVSGQKQWTPELPHLYFLTLTDNKGNELVRERFGFRKMEMKNGDLYFNGKRFLILGGRMPGYFNSNYRYSSEGKEPRKTSCCNENNFAADHITAAKKANFRVSRGNGNGYSETFLNLCDEMGHMMYLEMPRTYYQDKELLKRLIFQHYNHPSAAIWELGNEQFECWTPGITEYMSQAYGWVKNWDHQNRPVSPTSGMTVDIKAADADIVDLHHYFGQKEYSLKKAENYNKYIYDIIRKKYTREPAYIFFEGPPLDINPRHINDFWEKAGLQKIKAIKDRTARKAAIADAVNSKKPVHHQISLWLSEAHIGALAPVSFYDGTPEKMKEIYFERMVEFLRMYRRSPYLDGFSFGNCSISDLVYTDENGRQIPNKNITLIARCFAPEMVSFAPFRRNFFAGEKSLLNAVAVNNSEKENQYHAQIFLRYSDGREERLAESPAFKVASFKQKTITLPVLMPELKAPVHAQLILTLLCEGREINRQEYRIMIAPHPEKIANPENKRIAVYSSYSELFKGLDVADNPEKLLQFVRKQKIDAKILTDFNELRNVDILIIDEMSYDETVAKNAKKIKSWLEQGGSLLCLKQDFSLPVPWLNDALLDNVEPSSWTAPTDMEHPLYRGLLPEDLRGPFNGEEIIVEKGYSPMPDSSIAMNYSSRGWMGSLLDEKVGNGHAVHCQLDIAGRTEIDPVAAILLHNTVDYLLNGHGTYAVKSRELLNAKKRFFNMEIDFTHFVDLRKYANMGFVDDVAGDGKGGWLDFGNMAGFEKMPTGKQNFRGVLFDIIDPDNNGGRSCIAMSGVPKEGVDRSYFPKTVTGIPVNAKLKRLFFLHSAMYVTDKFKGKEILEYIFHYKSGRKEIFKAVDGIDIADWHHPEDKKNALVAYVAKGHDDGLYIAEWKNPFHDDIIETIDIISVGAVPGVVAISGERAD